MHESVPPQKTWGGWGGLRWGVRLRSPSCADIPGKSLTVQARSWTVRGPQRVRCYPDFPLRLIPGSASHRLCSSVHRCSVRSPYAAQRSLHMKWKTWFALVLVESYHQASFLANSTFWASTHACAEPKNCKSVGSLVCTGSGLACVSTHRMGKGIIPSETQSAPRALPLGVHARTFGSSET